MEADDPVKRKLEEFEAAVERLMEDQVFISTPEQVLEAVEKIFTNSGAIAYAYPEGTTVKVDVMFPEDEEPGNGS